MEVDDLRPSSVASNDTRRIMEALRQLLLEVAAIRREVRDMKNEVKLRAEMENDPL